MNIYGLKRGEGRSNRICPERDRSFNFSENKKHMLTVNEEGITAEVLSSMVGVSRSTARRYLEYLISGKKVHAELIYGSVGRPERRYFLVSS